MVAPQLYTSQFSNRYGEEWVFEYDPTKGEGVLRGVDVGWQEYPVVEGRVPGLILNDEEMQRRRPGPGGQKGTGVFSGGERAAILLWSRFRKTLLGREPSCPDRSVLMKPGRFAMPSIVARSFVGRRALVPGALQELSRCGWRPLPRGVPLCRAKSSASESGRASGRRAIRLVVAMGADVGTASQTALALANCADAELDRARPSAAP